MGDDFASEEEEEEEAPAAAANGKPRGGRQQAELWSDGDDDEEDGGSGDEELGSGAPPVPRHLSADLSCRLLLSPPVLPAAPSICWGTLSSPIRL